MPAWLRRFAKVTQQNFPAAGQCLGQTQQRVQPRVIGSTAFRRRQPFVNLVSAQPDVIGSEQRHRFRRSAIAPGAADFLVVGFDRLGQIGMRNPADVGFIHPHAKGDGRDNDQPVFACEPAFDNSAVFAIHAAVIMAGIVAVVAKCAGQRFGLGAGAAIYDTRLPAPHAGKPKNLLAGVVLGGKGKVNIGPVKTAKKGLRRFACKQFFNDFRARFRVGGCGKGRQRYVKRPPQVADAQVIGAEIMPPLADAMGFVHCNLRDADPAQQTRQGPGGQTFGRKVQQL